MVSSLPRSCWYVTWNTGHEGSEVLRFISSSVIFMAMIQLTQPGMSLQALRSYFCPQFGQSWLFLQNFVVLAKFWNLLHLCTEVWNRSLHNLSPIVRPFSWMIVLLRTLGITRFQVLGFWILLRLLGCKD